MSTSTFFAPTAEEMETDIDCKMFMYCTNKKKGSGMSAKERKGWGEARKKVMEEKSNVYSYSGR